jgi:CRISPR system Cascade subunit CasC
LYLDVHILQSLPPSNINRDDTGSPKSAVYGGRRRARVSSQAWKAVTRKAFKDLIDRSRIGERTLKAADLIAECITAQAQELSADASVLASDVLAESGIKVSDATADQAGQTSYLLFISQGQADKLAALAIEARRTGEKLNKRDVKHVLSQDQGVDVALFGRMVAEAPDLNVDAAAQVAHAISVHAVEPEFDYFTAMDDRQAEDTAGAGMIGTVEFNSSLLYRYANVNLPLLAEQLGSWAFAAEAARAFIQAFVTSMPTGKQNTFANRTLPAAVVVQLREGQPVNLVEAFETPVQPGDEGGYLAGACQALRQKADQVEAAYGLSAERTLLLRLGPSTEALAGLGEELTLAELADQVAVEVARRDQP